MLAELQKEITNRRECIVMNKLLPSFVGFGLVALRQLPTASLGSARWALLATLVLAECLVPANATTQWYSGTVQQIYPLSDGSFEIGTSSVLPTCAGNGNGGVYLNVAPGENSMTASGVQNMLATLLTTFALGRSIQIAYDDGTTSCYVNRLLMQ